MLELINRARANPAAEAARYGIGLNDGLAAGTITTLPKPPLAMHQLLIDAARAHSQWMIDTNTFSHTGSGGSSSTTRVSNAGYPLASGWGLGENLAIMESGSDSYIAEGLHEGLFKSASHRQNILGVNYDEIGIGIKRGNFTFSDGSTQYSGVATQNYAYSGGTPGPLLLGVIYYDLDGDSFYDPGEGVGAVQVSSVSGGMAVTSSTSSGGYALAHGSSGNQSIRFTDGSGQVKTLSTALSSTQNVKLDLRLNYEPPSITGPTTLGVGSTGNYSFQPSFGATGYLVRTSILSSNPSVAGAESSENSPVITQSSGYEVRQTDVKVSGSYGYHLAHPAPTTQSIFLNRYFYVLGNASVSLYSMLKAAMGGQVAVIKARAVGVSTWTTIWSQAGSGTWTGETSFKSVSASLNAFAGQVIELAFNYEFRGGSYYPQTSSSAGWFFDQVSFSGVHELVESASASIGLSTSFTFTPAANVAHLIEVIPTISGSARQAGLLGVDATGSGGAVLFPAATRVNSPAGGITLKSAAGVRPTFTWDLVTGATWYRVYVMRGGVVVYDEWVEGVNEWTPASNLEVGSYQWWVQTWNSAGYGGWSDEGAFSVSADVPEPPSQVTPASGAVFLSGDRPVFGWSAVTGATWYQVYVSRTSGGTTSVIWNTWYEGLTSVQIPAELSAGTYQWWVRSWNSQGYSDWSAAASFTVTKTVPSVPVVNPAANPAAWTIGEGGLPTMTWQAVSNATWYQIWINRNGVTYQTKWIEGGATTSYSADLPAGTYQWWVQSYNIDGKSAWTNGGTFTVTGAVPATATPTSPAQGATISTGTTATLAWSKAQYATWYRLWVSRDGTKALDTWIEGADTTNYSYLLNASGTYTFWIQTWNPMGIGAWSAGRTFIVQ